MNAKLLYKRKIETMATLSPAMGIESVKIILDGKDRELRLVRD